MDAGPVELVPGRSATILPVRKDQAQMRTIHTRNSEWHVTPSTREEKKGSPKASALFVQAFRSHWNFISPWGSTGSTIILRARCNWK